MSTLFEALVVGGRPIAETKVSLKANNKRLRKHSMLFIVLFAFFSVLCTAQQPPYGDFQTTYLDRVDVSSIKTCHTLGGKSIDEVESGNPEKGYKCTVYLRGTSPNKEKAMENCESRIPFYIIGAKPKDPNTECTFQINLNCESDYWQVKGKCYKVSSSRYTWQEAEKVCNVDKLAKAGRNPKIAEYYYKGLNNYFRDIMDVYDAWVYVPNLGDYYDNANGNAAFFVQEGSYKFDARPGTILMDDLAEKHQVMCEYTPEMTMAELFYIGDIYSEIYPLTVYHSGRARILTLTFKGFF